MKRYSFELKLRAINEYRAGEDSYVTVAEKFGIKNKASLLRWVNTYNEFGEEALLRSRQRQDYPVQLKIDAVELYLTTELSVREVANHFKLTTPGVLFSWISIYREKGVAGFSVPKGRPPKMKKKEKPEDRKETRECSKRSESDRVKELEDQVQTLRIENAFLKGLRRLRQEEKLQEMKRSQGSSATSEENSN